jgi:hypothetical protein
VREALPQSSLLKKYLEKIPKDPVESADNTANPLAKLLRSGREMVEKLLVQMVWGP